jgi:hypothetical protein
MMTDEEIDTLAGPQKLFIAELQSWPGNSGSPVFLSLGGVRGSVIIAGGSGRDRFSHGSRQFGNARREENHP